MERNDRMVTSEKRPSTGDPHNPAKPPADDLSKSQARRVAAQTKNGGYEDSGEGLLIDPDN